MQTTNLHYLQNLVLRRSREIRRFDVSRTSLAPWKYVELCHFKSVHENLKMRLQCVMVIVFNDLKAITAFYVKA